jgi:hypothetical protein
MRDLGSDTPENLRGQRKRKAIRHDLVGKNDGTYHPQTLQGLSSSPTEDIGKGKAINPQEEHRSRVDQPGEKFGSIVNKEIGLPEARMEQETTKVVREVTMPMIACQKQNALHKGIQGSNISHYSPKELNEMNSKVIPKNSVSEVLKTRNTGYGLADQQNNNKEVNTKTQVSGLVDSEGNYLIGSLGNDNRISKIKKTVRIGIAMSAETGEQVDIENLPFKKAGPV